MVSEHSKRLFFQNSDEGRKLQLRLSKLKKTTWRQFEQPLSSQAWQYFPLETQEVFDRLEEILYKEWSLARKNKSRYLGFISDTKVDDLYRVSSYINSDQLATKISEFEQATSRSLKKPVAYALLASTIAYGVSTIDTRATKTYIDETAKNISSYMASPPDTLSTGHGFPRLKPLYKPR